jgi:hypothetical protein
VYPWGLILLVSSTYKFGRISSVIGSRTLLSLCSRTPRGTLIYPKTTVDCPAILRLSAFRFRFQPQISIVVPRGQRCHCFHCATRTRTRTQTPRWHFPFHFLSFFLSFFLSSRLSLRFLFLLFIHCQHPEAILFCSALLC